MEVTIKNETVKLKNTMRAIMVYEQITGKPFSPVTMTDLMVYFYSSIISANMEIELTFDEFVEWLDDNGDKFTEFTSWLTKVNKINEPIKQPTPESKKKKAQQR